MRFLGASKIVRYESPYITVIGHVISRKQGYREHLKIDVKLKLSERGKLETLKYGAYSLSVG